MNRSVSLMLGMALVMAAKAAKADFTLGTPKNLGPVINSSASDFKPSIAADGLNLFFVSDRSGGFGGRDIWVATRETTDAEWGPPTNLGPKINSGFRDSSPSISANGLSLFFDSGRLGGFGGEDIWLSTRPTPSDPWGNPVNLGPTVNSSSNDRAPSASSDGLTLFLHSNRPGGSGGLDLWITSRESINDPWKALVNLGPTVNSSEFDAAANISTDGLVLFFMSRRPGGYGGLDLWVTRRPTTNDAWGAPTNLGPQVNSPGDDWGPSISADGGSLLFGSDRPGGYGNLDIWEMPIEPAVDFTGDYQVNIEDLLILIEHWGQNEPWVDMAPMPWGDGTVDGVDLAVLMSYWGQALPDPHFVAHWMLDETEGDIAFDSAGENDAVLMGDAVWQPESGQVGGALQLGGNAEHVSAPFVLNPAETVFSVFAWVKGGAPGQVVLSQFEGANWLMLDAQGRLKTTLKGNRRDHELTSETVISGDTWHRVGFTWDGLTRILYVNNLEVASDARTFLQGSQGDMIIGGGSGLDPGAFWSGLIDDVRIYDRVVHP